MTKLRSTGPEFQTHSGNNPVSLECAWFRGTLLLMCLAAGRPGAGVGVGQRRTGNC